MAASGARPESRGVSHWYRMGKLVRNYWIRAHSENGSCNEVFGSFRLGVGSYSPWRGEKRVPLTPKAFDVVRCLMERADQLVSQGEILDAP